MERKDFIDAIFSFFKVKDDERVLYKAYDLALSSGRNVDWSQLYMKTIKEAESRYLPVPKFFIENFDNCRKRTINSTKDDGRAVRIIFKDGRFTDFIVCGYGLSIDQLKERSRKKGYIKEIRMYPKQVKVEDKLVDVELIGEHVFPEGTPYEVVFQRV